MAHMLLCTDPGVKNVHAGNILVGFITVESNRLRGEGELTKFRLPNLSLEACTIAFCP